MLTPLAAVLEFSPEETRDAATAIRGAEAGLLGGIADKFGGFVGGVKGE